MEDDCPWCNRKMHLDVTKEVLEIDHTSMRPGTYNVYHCGSCRRSFHVLVKALEPERV